MPETVDCSECGTRYDSQEHPFCPRCGSTSRGAPLPGALASASRRAPGRRRVQAAGGVLLAIGLLFLLSASASFLLSAEETAEPFVSAMVGQPGGDLVLVFPEASADGNATATVVLREPGSDGDTVANGTAIDGRFVAEDVASAALEFEAAQGGASWNGTVLVAAGDRVEVALPEGGGEVPLAVSPDLRALFRWIPVAAVGLSLVLAAGGACALALRWFPAAAVSATLAGLLALLALFSLLATGILFALPLGLCAYFILAGRRHFRGRSPAPPASPPASPPSPPT